MKLMHIKLMRRLAMAAAVGVMSLSAGLAMAKDLTIGIRTEPSSLDPYFHSVLTNIQISDALFDTLVGRDANMGLEPRLAESWQADGNVWTFKLRPGVKFSDGSPLTAEDVVFSVNRIRNVPNSPSPFTIYLNSITKVEAVDDSTVRITTAKPYPLLLNNLSSVFIMSSKAAAGEAAEGKTTVQLNAGEGLVGTGPYKFESWRRGSDLVFDRNPYYWGQAGAWDKVIFRPIPTAATRVAALQAGDVDLIEDPAAEDLERLRALPHIKLVVRGPTNRAIFIGLDTDRAVTPGISGTDGKNPLQDVRVREALSLAIDRKALDDRIMNGMATPAAQLLPFPMFGTSEKLNTVPAADIERAKALLAEAGYPKGFELILGTPSGRYINDSKVAQTIAAMWARIGVKTTVEAAAMPVFFSNAQNLKFSAYLLGWGPLTGETSNSLGSLLGTYNKETAMGSTNYGRYSNPELDDLLAKASTELNDEKRSALLQRAGEVAAADYALLPIHFEHSAWAMKDTISYPGRVDQMTSVREIVPAK